MANVPSDARRAAYARPADDNGRGMHFRLDLRPAWLAESVGRLQQIHAKWTLIAGQDWDQCARAGVAVAAVGIMPVFRLICKIDGQHDFVAGMAKLKAAGFEHPYVQIFNEPGNGREWKGRISIKNFGGAWASNAIQVFDAGGYPGFQGLGPEEWTAAFNSIKAQGRMDIWQKAFWCLHNGGSNHPLNYPYDDVNQNGTPVTPAEFAAHEWAHPDINQINQWRSANKNPGATIMTDDTAVLRFLEYKAWMIRDLGFCLPFIGGEAGWAMGTMEDNRYPKIDAGLHAAYHRSMFEWFKTGILPNGEKVPDELFSVTDWIMADWGADGWWGGVLGTFQQTIDAVAAIPAFVRQFDGPNLPPEPPPIMDHTPLPDVTIAQLVLAEHFPDPELAVAIILAESGGDMNATNTAGNTPPSTDRGLWQFNDWWHSEITDKCAFDPVCATHAAFVISKGGTDFGQWAAFNAHTYEQFLTRATAAVIAAGPLTPPPPPPPDVFVDPRLTWLNYKQGDAYHLTEAWFYDSLPADDPESEGGVNIWVIVRDRNGTGLNHEKVTQSWPDGASNHYTRNGVCSFQMSGDSSFDPKKGQSGPYSITVGDASVSGPGLTLRQHVEYEFTFEKQS